LNRQQRSIFVVRPVKRKKKESGLMGSHQRCWIWGRMSVVETLRAGRWPILELHLSKEMAAEEMHAATRLADRLNLPVSFQTSDVLTRLCRSEDHQGYLAKMPPFPYDDAEEVLGRRRDPAFYLVLDAVQDPFNFGAIIRSADALGVDAIFVAAAQQADVTSLVVRSSAGAVNYMPLARVADLLPWLARLKQAGTAIVGSSPRAKRDISQCDFRRAVAVVLGNEAVGIRPEILSLCDERVLIRQRGHVGSLNAAVSAGILCYEVARQRKDDHAGSNSSRAGASGKSPST
jgi:23S rRNA (guanosine2251-2'-O)-methyltransferase